MNTSNRFVDITGKIFGKYTVLKYVGKSKWECKCSCGNVREVRTADLNSGNSTGCRNCSNGQEKGQTGLSLLFSKYKTNAKKYKREFTLSLEDFKKITSSNCIYCGIKPSTINTSIVKNEQTKEHSKYFYNGIDRRDSNKGYTLENSVPCCTFCNKAKSDLPESIFLNHLKRIYEYYKRNEQNIS